MSTPILTERINASEWMLEFYVDGGEMGLTLFKGKIPHRPQPDSVWDAIETAMAGYCYQEQATEEIRILRKLLDVLERRDAERGTPALFRN